MPEPLRPTMPKNSPWRISKETPSSARSSRYVARREGAHDPLLERVDPVGRDAEGLLQVPRLDREGRVGPRGLARIYGRALRRRASRRAFESARRAPRTSSGRGGRRTASAARRRGGRGRRRQRALLAQDDDELDARPGPRPRCRRRRRSARGSGGSTSGTRPGSRRACGSSSAAPSSSRARRDPLLRGLLLGARRALLVDDQPAPLARSARRASAPGPRSLSATMCSSGVSGRRKSKVKRLSGTA